MRSSTKKFETKFYSLVLMNNHFHMLLSTPNANLGDVTRHLITEISKGIQKEANRINHIFGGRYRWTLLDNCFSAAYVFKYIYRNPVRANICNKVENYTFSTLQQDPNKDFPPLENLLDPIWRIIPQTDVKLFDWLNQPTRKESEMLIRNGLRHHTFKFTKNNSQQNLLRDLRQEYGVENYAC